MARRPSQETKRELLNQEEVWEIIHETLSEYVPLEVHGDVYDKGDIVNVLLQAASTAGTIEGACDALEGIGGGNGIRYHLQDLDVATLEVQLNKVLVDHRPKHLLRKPRQVAVDIVLIPYYGTVEKEDEDFLIRSQAKAGTTRFFGYATLCLLHSHQRYTIALHCLRKSESLHHTLSFLLEAFEAVGGRIKRLLLDAGFYSVQICRYLIWDKDVPFVMPAPKKGKTGGIRKLFVGKCTYQTTYTMSSSQHGQLEVPVIVVCKYSKGRYGR